jgi:CheY-like chemotaxis protein
VEDEATLRATVARGLSRLPRVEVIAVGTVAEAIASIDQAPPDLLLSDIDLPDRSGIELLGELARRNIRCPVVIVSAYLRAYGAQIPPHAGVEVLEKPIALETLREVVQRRLQTQVDSPFAVVDYIQLACMGHRSVRVDFRADGFVGWIAVKEGTLWAAQDNDGPGVAAFQRLAFRRDGQIECTSLREDPGPRTIHEAWEGLLLEAARLFDESNYAGKGPLELAPPLQEPTTKRTPELAILPHPEPVEPAEPPLSETEHRFAVVWDRGLHALLARRYQEALEAFLEARKLCPEDRKVLANLIRLEAMGYHADQREPS